MLGQLNTRLFQYGYVGADLERATVWFERHLGVKGFEHFGPVSLGDAVVDGEVVDEWTIDIAGTMIGDVMLEIICPLAGAVDMYRDGLDPDAVAAFHHVGLLVDSWNEAEAARASLGVQWKTRGYTPGACDFGYVDLRPVIGHYVEFMRLDPEGVQAVEDLRHKYAPTAG